MQLWRHVLKPSGLSRATLHSRRTRLEARTPVSDSHGGPVDHAAAARVGDPHRKDWASAVAPREPCDSPCRPVHVSLTAGAGSTSVEDTPGLGGIPKAPFPLGRSWKTRESSSLIVTDTRGYTDCVSSRNWRVAPTSLPHPLSLEALGGVPRRF